MLSVETIDRTGLERAQKVLLPKRESGLRGGDEQREFIRLAKDDPDAFCNQLRSWGLTGGKTPPVTEHPIHEKEFVNPSWPTERAIAAAWRELPAGLAARPETWTRIHVEMIEQDRMESSYLAAGNKDQPGRVRIAQALRQKNAKDVDDCVREVLRRLGGVISRANRTAFLDCPLAKAWWRHRYAEEAYRVFQQGSIETLSNALRPSFRWVTLVEDMISRLTIIGDSGIRPALVQCLAEGVASTPREMSRVRNWIGRRSTVQALGAQGPQYVWQLVREEFLPSPE